MHDPFPSDQETKTTFYGVPVRLLPVRAGTSIRYVVVSDIPPDIAQQFLKDVCPCACPTVSGEEAFYAHDWERWAAGNDPRRADRPALRGSSES